MTRILALGAAALCGFVLVSTAMAQQKYGPGVSATEIRIGQTMAYSGPASAFGAIGRSEAAYFKMINEQDGINGRKIRLISLDDGYSPPKTVEQTRKLVEQEDVFAIVSALGMAQVMSVRKISQPAPGAADPGVDRRVGHWRPSAVSVVDGHRPSAALAARRSGHQMRGSRVPALRLRHSPLGAC